MTRSGFDGFRLSLAQSRERGAPFARAWKIAMRKTHPNARIYLALKDTKSAWEAAYEQRPAAGCEAALGSLASYQDAAPDNDVIR